MGERALDEVFAEYAENQEDVAADRESAVPGLQRHHVLTHDDRLVLIDGLLADSGLR
jgi:hypothetical protein